MSVEKSYALVGSQDYLAARFSPDFIRSLMWATRRVSERAVSYRNFKVGAIGALLFPDTQEVVLLCGTNNSPKRGADKRCAEMDIMHQATALANRKRVASFMLDLFVAGPNDATLIEEVNGLARPTLYPCGDCRDLGDAHPAILDTTRVVTFGVNEGAAVEDHTWGQIREYYEGKERPPISRKLSQGMAA